MRRVRVKRGGWWWWALPTCLRGQLRAQRPLFLWVVAVTVTQARGLQTKFRFEAARGRPRRRMVECNIELRVEIARRINPSVRNLLSVGVELRRCSL